MVSQFFKMATAVVDCILVNNKTFCPVEMVPLIKSKEKNVFTVSNNVDHVT